MNKSTSRRLLVQKCERPTKATGNLLTKSGFAGFVLALCCVGNAADYQSHVLSDNSLSDVSYYQSSCQVVSPSQLEMRAGKLPVETGHFVSPPNCLRMKWRSSQGGDWRVRVKAMPRYGRNWETVGDTLSVWCYSETELSADASPRINLQDADGIGSGTIALLATRATLPAKQWVRLSLPLAGFKSLYPGTEGVVFNPRRIESIWMVQGLDDGQDHTLYFDDWQVYSIGDNDSRAPAPPQQLAIHAGERHFDLTWRSNSEPDLLSYRIYRSEDGSNFKPVKIQRGDRARAVDFVGATNYKASYRLTALDVAGNESPPSEVVSAVTRAFSDDELLEMAQEACFRYYWEGAHPVAGMGLEIVPGDRDLVAVGGSGFGVMALLVGAERKFVTREQCAQRILQIVRFLQNADRFHGAWPHFLHGDSGRVYPYFGKYDNGGDLVETAFMVQGLLAARQYFDRDLAVEQEIRETITKLWQEVEWDWYLKTPESPCLYWHWSPDHGWYISHPLVGWNETMIVYLLAIASPTHGVPASLYHSGWAGQADYAVQYRRYWSRTTQGDHFVNGNSYYGFKLEVGEGSGADLFFTQFSFMGFDPRGKRDAYADYFINNRNIARINRAYCIENPRKHQGYGADCWGLSAGINSGGGRPQPRDDNGTICCSAGVGSMPYTPAESLAVLKHFYRDRGAKVWGEYGFHDGFNESEQWFEPVWMALNQAVITVMIENHRSGLIWRCFMRNPEIAPALTRIGFKEAQEVSR